MMMTFLTQAGMVPALLIALVGMLVHHTAPDHKAGRRVLHLTLIADALLVVVVSVTLLFDNRKEPLPTSVVSIPRTPAQPLFRSRFITLGTWSPDGGYLCFGALDITEDRSSVVLHFLHAESGEVCRAERHLPMKTDWHRQTAWLPDGRLLFLSTKGEMALLTPCVAGVERLTGRYPATFDQVAAYEGMSGRILLESEGAFWILDGVSLEARQIPGVSPNPYDAHWDHYAWSPDGEHLAISRLNGRDRTEESTLYLVAGDTGEVVHRLPLEYASDQQAPWVEWLAKDELLYHGGGVLAIVNFRSHSPRMVDVLKDIFALDIDYPREISSMASVVHPAGGHYTLAVRVNHPRNQNLYLYHSETDSVVILQHEVHTLLFFPKGEWEQLPKWEDPPTYRDEYELVWVDTPRDARRLVVQGHTPRDTPHLLVRYLPQSSQAVFSSSQGVSLVSVPDGELLRFWELAGGEDSSHTYVRVSPNGEGLVVMEDKVGMYWIPLPH
jgi:WD40 repeat protein